jgi:hypothetical protein
LRGSSRLSVGLQLSFRYSKRGMYFRSRAWPPKRPFAVASLSRLAVHGIRFRLINTVSITVAGGVVVISVSGLFCVLHIEEISNLGNSLKVGVFEIVRECYVREAFSILPQYHIYHHN